MKKVFTQFEVTSATETTLTVRMFSGETYTLWRGLDHNYKRLFKLQLNGEFFRTPDFAGGLARHEFTGETIPVQITRYNLGSLTKAGW